MQDFRKLEAWQKSHALVLHTYAETSNFPESERFGLTSQMRRAAVSVPAKLEYYIILVGDLTLLPERTRTMLAAEVSDVKAVITGLMKAVLIGLQNRPQTVNRRR